MRAPSYLSLKSGSWIFQIRLPRSLDPDLCLSSLRISLGAMPRRQARELALELSAAAKSIFGRIAAMNEVQRQDFTLAGARTLCQTELLRVLPVLAAMDGSLATLWSTLRIRRW